MKEPHFYLFYAGVNEERSKLEITLVWWIITLFICLVKTGPTFRFQSCFEDAKSFFRKSLRFLKMVQSLILINGFTTWEKNRKRSSNVQKGKLKIFLFWISAIQWSKHRKSFLPKSVGVLYGDLETKQFDAHRHNIGISAEFAALKKENSVVAEETLEQWGFTSRKLNRIF